MLNINFADIQQQHASAYMYKLAVSKCRHQAMYCYRSKFSGAGLLLGFPHDNGLEQVLQYLLVALSAGVSVTFFAGGFVLAAVQE